MKVNDEDEISPKEDKYLDKLVRLLVDITVDDIIKENQQGRAMPNLSKVKETSKK